MHTDSVDLPCLPRLYAERRGENGCEARQEGGGSLDHLIGPQQQRRRDREAERFRGLEVDD